MRRILPILLTTLVLTGCTLPVRQPSTPPPATQTPFPSATAVLAPGGASLTPSFQPYVVQASAGTPIRSGPGIGYPQVGQVTAGNPVELVGVDDNGHWWAVLYDSSPTGYGWLPLDSLTAPVPPDQLPILTAEMVAPGSELAIAASSAPATPAPADLTISPSITPTAAPPTPAAPYGTVLVEINVREKPAQNFDSIGTLAPGSYVVLTGRTLSGYWFRIEFAASPTGFGWVAVAYVRADSEVVKALPYYNNLGEPVTTPTAKTTTTPGP
jgi:uncharacterized protein YraI